MKRIKKIIFNEYFLLSILILLGILARVYRIDSPIADWHSFRQADTASVTRIYVEKGINILYPRYHDLSGIQSGMRNPQGYRYVEFPLYNVIHANLVKVYPKVSLEVWGRILTIICSLASLFALFLIGKLVFNKWVGILSAFFYAFLPFNIYYSRVILPEPLATTLLLLALYLALLYVRKEKLSLFYISGVLLGIAALIRPYSLFYLILIFYIYVEKFGFRNVFKRGYLAVRFLVYLSIIIIPFFTWRWWIDKRPEGVPFYYWIFNLGNMRFHPSFWRWVFGERIGSLILGIWGIFPFALGLVYKNSKNYFLQVYALTSLLYLVVFAAGNIRHDYYQYFIIPQIVITLAYGVYIAVTEKTFIKGISIPLVVLSVVLMFGLGAYKVKDYYIVNHPEIIEAGKAVDKIAPKDALVIASYNGDTAFLYQTKRSGWPVVDDSIENLIKWGADYFVSVNFGDNDLKYVKERYKTVEETNKYVIVDLNQKIK